MRSLVTPGLALILAGIICAIDLGSKMIVVESLAYGQQIDLLPSLNIVHAVNQGAAFGLLATAGGWQRYFFIAIALLASILLIYMIRKPTCGTSERCGLSMILGGATGNLIDRTIRTGVVDWIDLYVGLHHWPAFNIADSAIMLGVATLIFQEVFRPKAKPSILGEP